MKLSKFLWDTIILEKILYVIQMSLAKARLLLLPYLYDSLFRKLRNNGFVFPFIYDDCTEELDNEREKNFFSELFKLADKNQIIYLTHNYELVERLKKLSNNCNFIELENYRNL